MCVLVRLSAKVSNNCLLFYVVLLHIGWRCKFNTMTSFSCLIPYNRFNVISLLSQNAINEGLPSPSTESQTQPI